MSQLRIEHLVVSHPSHSVLEDLSLQLPEGMIGCLMGPSGCGKTTLLRAIAGFERPLAGSILIGERPVSSSAYFLPTEQREVGMIFQEDALFPHLSVEQNIGFGLFRWNKTARKRRVIELLDLIHLSDQAHRYPHQLSGGQRQRVALARALAPRPGLLLMDEPFSGLDAGLRSTLSKEVRDILRAEGSTALLVTHDPQEAFALADYVGVLYQGRLQQWGTPYTLYHEPVSPMVARFVGDGVMVPGVWMGEGQVQIELGALPASSPITASLTPHQPVDVLLRPDDVTHDDASPQQAIVAKRVFRGADFLYTLSLPSGQQILSLVPSHHNHALGESIGICLAVDHVVIFPSSSTTPPV